MEKFTTAVAGAFVLGLVAGAIGWAGFGAPVGTADSGPDAESPGYSLSTSGPDCLDVRPHGGWVHEVAVGESFAVTLNATVVHDPGRTVSANVSRTTPGTYRIALETVADGREVSKAAANDSRREGCRVATHVRLGTGLPTDYRQFDVTVNGHLLLTVENEDTTGDLYQLPNPVNATASAE
ncbi:hypothetical protein [Halorussus aquaticus]|uniref:Secreted protein n=1 Tax=Halorussus aquaticus TaxID=2953748 RepID=A0ABD5PWS1_9EURY|nr:hypothetical protein [Halorussus aquaticus]